MEHAIAPTAASKVVGNVVLAALIDALAHGRVDHALEAFSKMMATQRTGAARTMFDIFDQLAASGLSPPPTHSLEEIFRRLDSQIETNFVGKSQSGIDALPFAAFSSASRQLSARLAEAGVARIAGPPTKPDWIDRPKSFLIVDQVIVTGVNTPTMLGGHTPMSAAGFWLDGMLQGGANGFLRDRLRHWQAADAESRDRSETTGPIFIALGSGQNEYFPMLTTTLPSLLWYRLLGIDLPILLPAFDGMRQPALAEAMKATFAALGIPPDRAILPADTVGRKFSYGIAPVPMDISPGLVEFYRRIVLPVLGSSLTQAPEQFGPLIYITRKGAARRPLLNEDEVIEIVQRRGFTVLALEDMTFEAQIMAFHHAQSIVAPHGAGLTNLVFARAGASLLELIAKGTDQFRLLARYAGMEYECLVSTELPATPPYAWRVDRLEELDAYCRVMARLAKAV